MPTTARQDGRAAAGAMSGRAACYPQRTGPITSIIASHSRPNPVSVERS